MIFTEVSWEPGTRVEYVGMLHPVPYKDRICRHGFSSGEAPSAAYDKNKSLSRECALQKTPPEQALDAKSAPTSGDRSSARRVALVGFGTVGRAVAKILCERTDGLLRLTHICNRNFERKKQPWVPGDVVWTDDLQTILSSEADIVVELIGGLHPAEDLVRGALNAGMSVVTANKQLIARHGPELLQLASANGCQLEFGASVAGGV